MLSFTQIVVIIIGNAACTFLISYFTERGRIYATKHDLNKITEIVEGIKLQHSSTLALLNTNLSLASKGIENF